MTTRAPRRLVGSGPAIPALLVLAVAASVGVPLGAAAQGAAPNRPAAEAASVARGRLVAIGSGLEQARPACVQCHGLDGAASAGGAVPRLAGQSGWYLYKALRDYASGARQSTIMGPVARALDDRAMQDVAAHYAAVELAGARPQTVGSSADRQTGGALVAIGDAARGVAACANCHQDADAGLALVAPSLAGQPASYLAKQLLDWKTGRRTGDPMRVMQTVARAITEDQIRAVAAYYASLAPTGRHMAEAAPGARPVPDAVPSLPAEAPRPGVQPPYLPSPETAGPTRAGPPGDREATEPTDPNRPDRSEAEGLIAPDPKNPPPGRP